MKAQSEEKINRHFSFTVAQMKRLAQDPVLLRLYTVLTQEVQAETKMIWINGRYEALRPGEILTGRYSLHRLFHGDKSEYSEKLSPSASTIIRTVEKESEHQTDALLNIRPTNKYSIIKLLNFKIPQAEHQTATEMNIILHSSNNISTEVYRPHYVRSLTLSNPFTFLLEKLRGSRPSSPGGESRPPPSEFTPKGDKSNGNGFPVEDRTFYAKVIQFPTGRSQESRSPPGNGGRDP